MLGEFFRDAAVLVSVFFPLEMARSNNGNFSLTFVLLVAAVTIGCFIAGTVFERMR